VKKEKSAFEDFVENQITEEGKIWKDEEKKRLEEKKRAAMLR